MERTKSEIKLLQTNYVALQDNAIKDNWKFIVEQYGSKDVLKNDDFKLIEDSYQECFKSLLYSFDSTGNIILNGVEVSDDGVDVACTEGWVSWLGEIYKVEATTFPYSSGGQLFLKLETTILNPSPTTYKNATIQNVHLDRKLVFKYYVTADIGEYLINFNRFVNLGVPKGTVLDWFGNVSALFDNSGLGVGKMGGYGICNGNTYTVGIVTQTVPDLRGLFVVGATVVPNTGAPLLDPVRGTYNLTDTGGETHHALTEDENATHDHDYYTILNSL
jgi:hypothetical protein